MGFLRKLSVKYLPIGKLIPGSRKLRMHSKKHIHQLANSIRRFGWTIPILIDAAGRIIAGDGRFEAAKLEGLTEVPTICIEDLSDAELRAYVIADNRLAELAGWDNEILAIELGELSTLDLGFDLEITGFETAEIDLLIDGCASANKNDPADLIPPVEDKTPPVSRVGDLWLLGDHRLLCANALEPGSYDLLMAGTRARLVFTDPPYNVPIDGHVGGLGRTKHADFAMAAGEMGEAEFTAFLATALASLTRSSIDGAVLYVCIDWRHVYELITASRTVELSLLNVCIWNKTNGGMGSFYRSKHELVFVFKNGTAPHLNNIELGKHGRYRTNVWDYAGVNTFKPGRLTELHMHPTVKPVAMVADAIKDCSRRGDIVLDPFAGSGTTIVAAQKTGRRAFAMEIEPRFIDTTIRRWQECTGKEAVLSETGGSFARVEEQRRSTIDANADRAKANDDVGYGRHPAPASRAKPQRRQDRAVAHRRVIGKTGHA